MATSKDREELHVLNGNAAPFSYKTSMPWKHEPTPIKPSNSAPGSNPFGQNLNRRVGNVTSTRVLSRSSDPPPRKKVKTEHTHPHTATGPYAQHGNRDITRYKHSHESLIAPETIDVDDYSVMLDDNSLTNIGNSSTDELNIRSPSTEGALRSKYTFDSTVRNDNPPIAPDGKNTEWAKKKYSQVRERVEGFEAMTRGGDQPNMIDLRTKTKNKMKTKDKKNKIFPPQQSSQGQPSRAPAKKNTLPLKEFYLDDTYYNSEELGIYWLPGDKITIKSGGRLIFGPCDIRVNARSLTYHEADSLNVHDPVFKLTIYSKKGRNKAECLTVRLDCSSPGAEESYYTDLLDWLKIRVDDKEIIRASDRNNVWNSVAWTKATGSDFSTNQGEDSRKSSRLEELRQGEPRRALRRFDDRSKPAALQKRSASQSSLRFTPPIPSSNTVSDNQKPKQRSRQNTSDLPVVPRRSTRNMSGATRSPALDSDEVILVYPSGVPGAVNITNGDYFRLEPGEFLNDTLIEFGLKLWLKELEQTDAILASQIHVFNSFFYKKLNHHQKGTDLGYESVRKWTSKFDIFQKKYIIVPINERLHWYLAIICDPEYVLVPTASNVIPPSTRRQTRQSIPESMITDEPNEKPIASKPIASKPVSTSVSENGRDEDKFPSETEVEDTLHDFKGSCTISNIEPDEDIAGADGGRSPSVLSYVSDDGGLSANLRTANHDDPVSEICSVDVARFYQHASPPKGDKGKRKADPEPESSIMEIDDDDNDGSAMSDTPGTYIFTFDSLGGRHPQAIRKLSAYLKREALDKKNVVNTGAVLSKSAPVPAQPNFCDCGIYLLHLAQTFMSDPVHYRRMILAHKKGLSITDRQAAWHDNQVSNKREDLRARILLLSDEWKKERAAKEEAKHKEISNSHTVEVVESDCEIDILEPTPSTSKAKSGGRTGQAANRLRG